MSPGRSNHPLPRLFRVAIQTDQRFPAFAPLTLSQLVLEKIHLLP